MLYKRLLINGAEYLLAVNQAGQGAPTESTVGAPGVLYMDTDTEKFYKCTAAVDGVYTWKAFETGGSSDSSQNAGLTADQINALDGMFKVAWYDDTKDYAGAYAAFKDAFGLNVPATGITLSKAALNFADTASQHIAVTVEPSNSTDTVVWTTSAPSVATVVNGVVTPVANGNCTITATAGSVSASCTVSVAFEEEVVSYSITNNLTNCASNNSTASIVEGGFYSATLTADDGYTLEGASVSVLVNGEDVTDTAYADGVITIQNVTGNVVITVSAVEASNESDEVVILKSITGDGASYIDTEITPESLFSTYGVDISVELSAKIADFTSDINLFGANQSKLYGSYGAFCANNGTMYCRGVSGAGNINSQDTNGFWNTAAVPNLYTEQRWFRYAVTKDGTLASVYMDEAMTTLPASANADFTAFTNYDEESLKTTVPIIPMYIFAVNVGTDASQLITDKTPTAYTLYYFRIKKYSTGEVLHEFMPAMQGDRVGLYDTVTQKFYENKGTGSFAYEEVSA